MEENIFKVIQKTEGKAKNKIDKVSIETSVKGLMYRSEVYLDNHIIDAKEVNCQDLASAEDGNFVFRERYLATHRKFEDLYLAERIFVQVLADQGDYIEGEGTCTVNTSIFENIVRHEVFVDANEIDKIEEPIDKELAENSKAFKVKYKQLHQEVLAQYIKVPKFPTNTFLNPILKKYPFYDTRPMVSLLLFLLTVAFVLWLISLLVCGKAFPKIIKKVGGKEAALVVKDLQKSFCGKAAGPDPSVEPKQVLDESDVLDLYGTKYVLLPKNLVFKKSQKIKAIYFKNNLMTDLIVSLRDRMIDDFSSPLATPDMVIKTLTETTLQVKGSDVGVFEFKIEEEFLKNTPDGRTTFTGNLVFDVIDVRAKQSDPVAVRFEYTLEGAESAPAATEGE